MLTRSHDGGLYLYNICLQDSTKDSEYVVDLQENTIAGNEKN